MRNLKLLLISFLALPLGSYAQSAPGSANFLAEVIIVLIIFISILSMVAIYASFKIIRLLKGQEAPEEETTEEISLSKDAGWGSFWNKINVAVPVAREAEVATDHEYDGIRELDNRLPPWWLYGFYFTIAFAVVYLLNFHVFKIGKLQDQEYQAQMERAEAEVQAYLASMPVTFDEASIAVLSATGDLAAGKQIFEVNCTPCHAIDGGGVMGLGPNLTDKYWVHGGGIQDIFFTIKNGVPAKGMVAWSNQLSGQKMLQVASYVYSLEGTTPANPKEPEGELYERIKEEGQINPDEEQEETETDPADEDETVASNTTNKTEMTSGF